MISALTKTQNALFVPSVGAAEKLKGSVNKEKSYTKEERGYTRITSRDSIERLRQTISELRAKMSEIMTGNESQEVKSIRSQSIQFTITEIETIIAQKQRSEREKTIKSVYVNNQDLKKPDSQSLDTSMLSLSVPPSFQPKGENIDLST